MYNSNLSNCNNRAGLNDPPKIVYEVVEDEENDPVVLYIENDLEYAIAAGDSYAFERGYDN